MRSFIAFIFMCIRNSVLVVVVVVVVGNTSLFVILKET